MYWLTTSVKYMSIESLIDLSIVSLQMKQIVKKTLNKRKLEYAIEKGWDDIASNGKLEGITLLHKYNIFGCSVNTMDNAAENGHLEIVKFLHDHRSEGCTSFAKDLATKEGHIEIVKFLHYNRPECLTSNALYLSLLYGYIHIAEWLKNNTDDGWCPEYILIDCCERNILSSLRWLYKNCPHFFEQLIPELIIKKIILSNYVDVIKFIYGKCNFDILYAQQIAEYYGKYEIEDFFNECIDKMCYGSFIP